MELKICTFEELSNTELYRILKARVDIFVVEQKCPYPEIDGIDERAVHLFLQEDGKILSYLRVFEKDPDTMQIGRVISTVRGKGYALSLLNRAVQWIQDNRKDHKNIVLEAQTYAVGLYEKAGFHVVSEPFDDDGIMHVIMTRDTF